MDVQLYTPLLNSTSRLSHEPYYHYGHQRHPHHPHHQHHLHHHHNQANCPALGQQLAWPRGPSSPASHHHRHHQAQPSAHMVTPAAIDLASHRTASEVWPPGSDALWPAHANTIEADHERPSSRQAGPTSSGAREPYATVAGRHPSNFVQYLQSTWPSAHQAGQMEAIGRPHQPTAASPSSATATSIASPYPSPYSSQQHHDQHQHQHQHQHHLHQYPGADHHYGFGGPHQLAAQSGAHQLADPSAGYEGYQPTQHYRRPSAIAGGLAASEQAVQGPFASSHYTNLGHCPSPGQHQATAASSQSHSVAAAYEPAARYFEPDARYPAAPHRQDHQAPGSGELAEQVAAPPHQPVVASTSGVPGNDYQGQQQHQQRVIWHAHERSGRTPDAKLLGTEPCPVVHHYGRPLPVGPERRSSRETGSPQLATTECGPVSSWLVNSSSSLWTEALQSSGAEEPPGVEGRSTRAASVRCQLKTSERPDQDRLRAGQQEASYSPPSPLGVRATEIPRQAEAGQRLSPKWNQCHICNRHYARPSTLKTHLRTHTNERPFQCNICFKSFSQAANLTAHKRVHTGERPFACPICLRRFSQSSSVITHLRTHSGEKPYRCHMCNRTFSDSSTLTKHCRVHSGEKPYRCDHCPLSFSQSGNLSRHLRLHAIAGHLARGRRTARDSSTALGCAKSEPAGESNGGTVSTTCDTQLSGTHSTSSLSSSGNEASSARSFSSASSSSSSSFSSSACVEK